MTASTSGHRPAPSDTANATPCRRRRSSASGAANDACRGSSACTIGRSASVSVQAGARRRSSCSCASLAASPVVRGRSVRNASSRSWSKAVRAGELPQDGPEPAAEREDAARDEVGDRRPHVPEPLHVGDEARSLDREREALGGLVAPRDERRRSLQRVERPVELDGGEERGDVLELATLGEPRGVERSAPVRVPPPRETDPDGGHEHQPRGAARPTPGERATDRDTTRPRARARGRLARRGAPD